MLMTAAGGIGEPEEGYRDGDAGYGDSTFSVRAEDGVEEERDPDGGEEFGVGGSLEGGEEGVGVDDVEAGGDEGGGLRGESTGEAVEGDTGGGEDEPGVEDGGPGPWKQQAEDGSYGPGEGRVEDEAGLACSVGWGEGPGGVEVAVTELLGGFQPA